MKFLNKRAQAVAEMAIFGSVVLVLVGVVISYVQKLNDQQCLEMESFRRSLQRANTFQSEESESPGASVQMVQIENTRQADIMGEFAKGTTQTQDNQTNVFWAVPTEGAYYNSGEEALPKDLVLGRINEDEQEVDPFPLEFYVNSSSDIAFAEDAVKSENPGSIDNARFSDRQEILLTQIPGMGVAQNSYRNPDKQYRYYSDAPGRAVGRGMRWSTPD